MVGIVVTFAMSELPTDGGSCERARAKEHVLVSCSLRLASQKIVAQSTLTLGNEDDWFRGIFSSR